MFWSGYIPSPRPRCLQHVQRQHVQIQLVEMWLATIGKQYTTKLPHKSSNIIDIMGLLSRRLDTDDRMGLGLRGAGGRSRFGALALRIFGAAQMVVSLGQQGVGLREVGQPA